MANQVAAAALTNLTAHNFVPVYPAGAVEVRFLLVGSIHVTARAAAIHHVGVRVQGRKNVAAYATQGNDLTAQAVLGLAAADGVADGKPWLVDVSALIDESGASYDFRFDVQSDNAGAVTYTTEFALIMVYTV